ncbi:MAG TPA: hypothetical protein VH599_15935 [Ktedonobacterales bacterium]|jgi:hypothetical protein
MALVTGRSSSSPSIPPSARFAFSNPLRREYGLRLLTGNMPEPLRGVLIKGLRRPPLFSGQQTPLAVQSAHRRRLSDTGLLKATVNITNWLIVTELGVTRRTVEAPLGSISRVTRNTLLVAQGAQLRRLYLALMEKLGDPGAALTVFQQALDDLG